MGFIVGRIKRHVAARRERIESQQAGGDSGGGGEGGASIMRQMSCYVPRKRGEEATPREEGVQPRGMKKLLYDGFNTMTVQFLFYLVYVFLFQFLIFNLRSPDEYYMSKYVFDNILNQPWSDWDEDQFMGIANHEDIYVFVDNALLPALLQEEWPGGGPKSPAEIAKSMDVFDWTTGLSLRQARAAESPPEACGSFQTMTSHMWYLVDKDLAKGDDLYKATRRFGPCYPNFGLIEGIGLESQESYGFNRTNPDQPLSIPYKFHSSADMGSDPAGQTSASIDSQYNVVPSSGFASIFIPFFSEKFLEEENGHFSEVTDFRSVMYEVTSGRAEPNFWCIRLSWDGENVKQLCDPNNKGDGAIGDGSDGPQHKGETTGVVSAAVLAFWDEMKQAHWLDSQSRIVTLTLPLRNNHNGMRMRLSMVIQISANGGVLPSYDIDSRHDAAAVGMDMAMVLLWVTLVLVVYFLMIEAFEAKNEGLASYFTNMWNAMDWAGFLLFFLVFDSYQKLYAKLHDQSCDNGAFLCTGVGFNDGWAAMAATKTCKQFLSIASTLQMLKIIKFVNVFVPKMALATSVLSHGLADLFMFTLFFLFTIFAFGQMFFIQLGAIDPSYLGQFASTVSLFRALFGDFDIQLIMDSSDSYLNGMLFVAYLFSAVFILLSIFLTILGENQEAVRTEQAESNIEDYGVFAQGFRGLKALIFGKEPEPEPGTNRSGSPEGEEEVDIVSIEHRAILRGNEDLGGQLQELKDLLSAGGGAAAGTGLPGPAALPAPSNGTNAVGKAAEAERVKGETQAEVDRKMQPLAAQTSLARLRAAQAAHSVDGLEKWLLVIRNKQDEQGELLRQILEKDRGGHRGGHRSSHSSHVSTERAGSSSHHTPVGEERTSRRGTSPVSGGEESGGESDRKHKGRSSRSSHSHTQSRADSGHSSSRRASRHAV